MKLLTLGLLVLSGIAAVGCGSGDPPPVVGQNAPGTENVMKAMDSPEMKAREAARNASRGGEVPSQAGQIDRSR